MKISKELWEKLTESNLTKTILDSPPPSGLVSFKLNKDYLTSQLVNKLADRKICIRELDDPPCLRACTHIFTSKEETEILVDAISSILKN